MLTRILCGLLSLVAIAHADDQPAKPSLCFVTEWAGGEEEDVPLVDELRRDGFLVDYVPFHELTAQVMSRYNTLIFPEFPMTDAHQRFDSNWQVRPQVLEAFYPAIEKYVQDGGGVVVYGVCFFQTHKRGMENMNRMLQPWGAQTLFEQVLDSERIYQYRHRFGVDYSWTENLAAHPLTQDLRRVFYVTDNQHGPRTCTFKLADEWQVIVRGAETARSVPCNDAAEFLVDQRGSYDTAPPIVAVREYGKGRVALVGVTPVVAVFGGRFVGYANVLLENGNGAMRSDFGKLQQRIYRWSAEPALKAGAPGGFTSRPRTYRIPEDLDKPTIDWAKFDPGDGSIRPMRGVIGARTAAGGGGGEVEQYVQAAEAAGLDFVAFAEDLTGYSADSWEAFRQRCRAASTASVLAIPGMLYRDVTDSRFVLVGDFAYPARHRLSEDGSRIVEQQWWFDTDWCLLAPIDVGNNPRPFWTYSCYSALAVRTYQDGKLIDDAREAYLDRQEIEDQLTPIVVNLLSSPQQLGAGRDHVTGVMVGEQKALLTEISRNAANGHLFFAGNGPVVNEFRLINPTRTTQGRWGMIPGTERTSLRFKVTSERGIKSVRVLDGPHTLRRFDARGEKEFVATVHLLHDRQRHLMVEAEDVEGGVTISGQYKTGDQLQWRHMCSDRGNTINPAVLRTAKGRVYIAGPIAAYQRKNTMFGFFPGLSDLPALFGAPYVDGGLRPVTHSSTPELAIKDQPAREGVFASRMVHPLSSRDVIIQQSDLVGWYSNPHANAWNKPDLVEPLADYQASVRWIEFVKRDHDPGFALVEATIRLLRDLELDPRAINPIVHRVNSGSSPDYNPAFSVRGVEGRAVSGLSDGQNPPHLAGAMDVGGFVSFLPNFSGAGAAIVLDNGYRLEANMTRPHISAALGLNLGGQKLPKGHEIRYRLLVGRGIINGEPTDREWSRTVEQFGIAGPPAYDVKISQGRLLSTQYVLEAEADGGGVCAAIGSAPLPVRLPIRIRNVSPRCSAAIVDLRDQSFLPIGVAENESVAYATWDTSTGPATLYIGNLATCDDAALSVTVVRQQSQWLVEVHNPTEQPRSASVRGAARVESLADLNRQVEVPAGQSIFLTVP